MLKFIRQELLLTLFLGMALYAGAPEITNLAITNLSALPHYPWDGKVDITFNVECDDAEAECEVSFHGYDKDLDKFVEVISLSGDGVEGTNKIGMRLLRAGGPYKVVWDSAADYPDGHSSCLAVVVNVGFYMVVDLTTGKHRYSATAPDLSNDTCRTTELWLRYIPAGSFVMGSPTDEVGRFDNEVQHQVALTEDYYIGVFEMTQKQYTLITGGNPSKYKGDCRPVEQISYNMLRGTGAEAGGGWPTYKYVVDDGSVMEKLRTLTGLQFDLPTEAQWEFACRAGTTTALNSGKNLTNAQQDSVMDEVGRYYYNRNSGQHANVGSYLPNAWGLYDMHGNVLEWCLDWLGDYTGDTTDPVGPASGGSRVLRGGCWGYYSSYVDYGYAQRCRSAFRYGSGPSNSYYSYDNYSYGVFGFRVCVRP